VKSGNDWLTTFCVGVIAACVVTADHEAFGHGSACLLLHGHITLLTSSLFRCDARSVWIDPAGPFGNLLGGTIALALSSIVPARFAALRLILLSVTAMSYFWEGAYLVDAMATRHGDLYLFAESMLGNLSNWARALFVVAGAAFYLFAARLAARALLALWPEPKEARGVARLVWLGGTSAAALAACAFRGQQFAGNFRDAVLEIGVASLPLLIIPRGVVPIGARPSQMLSRNYAVVALALVVLAIFTLTLGRGVIGQ